MAMARWKRWRLRLLNWCQQVLAVRHKAYSVRKLCYVKYSTAVQRHQNESFADLKADNEYLTQLPLTAHIFLRWRVTPYCRNHQAINGQENGKPSTQQTLTGHVTVLQLKTLRYEYSFHVDRYVRVQSGVENGDAESPSWCNCLACLFTISFPC